MSARTKEKMRDKRFKHVTALVVVMLAASVVFYGCGRSGNAPDAANAPKTSVSPQRPPAPFETELDYVRKGQFLYIFVFKRKDGGAFDREDIAYLKANSPEETNQWVVSDDRRYVLAGTNFEFKPEQLGALGKRFVIEDYTGK